jgi:tetratricopeptide (TPR) repeat protein
VHAGDVIAGRFEVERAIGSGGMGTVYLARDRHTGERVAAKTLRSTSEDRRKRFAMEAEALHKLSHPRIVRYVAHGQTTAGELYLAMEWVDGETLSVRLKRGAMSLRDTFDLAVGISEALAAAHRRHIVHRDIKPGNLLLLDDSTRQVKLVDFGLARLEDSQALTRTGELLGTPAYMSPEQARGDQDVDARADVFSLGCVLFRCLTGRRAFEGDNIVAVLAKLVLETPPAVRELNPKVPPELDDLVGRMLAKDRGKRPADGTELLDELEEIAACVDDVAVDEAPKLIRPSQLPSAAMHDSLATLTGNEQRVMCIVLARHQLIDAEDETRIVGEQPDQLHAVSSLVQPFGGRAAQLIDGSLLITVTSGAPSEQAARAASCALAMRKAMRGMSIGLASGRSLVSGNALLGEAIDRAAALLTADDLEHVRIDDAAAALMRERFKMGTDERGLFLRGPRTETETGTARRLLGKPTRCVGRVRELKNLEAMFEECAAEPVARAAVVVAPAGIGKSRLRYEFLRNLEKRGTLFDADEEEVEFQVWVGRCDPMSAGSAFAMLASAVRQAIGIRAGESLELRREKLLKRVARHVPDAERDRVTTFLGEMIGTSFGEEQSVQLRAARGDPMLMGDQMRRAWEDFVAAECRAEPLLLVLEDLHWGDLPSVSFIDSALRNLHDHPLMVLGLARPEVRNLFPNLWVERDVQEIRLSKLTPKASTKLVRQVIGDEAGEGVVEQLVEQAAGNAFYLEELIRAVAEGRGDRLPDTVLAMVQARLEELDAEARRVLRAASVFGQVFWQDGVKALVGGEDTQVAVDDWLRDMVERELITPRAESKFPAKREYTFRHGLVREAAYAALTDADRTLGHRIAGRWLDDVGEEQAVVLAEHFERGDEKGSAVGWYRRAAEQALEGNDLEAAMTRAERGTACGASGEHLGALRLVEAEAHRWRGEFADMERCAVDAMRELPRGRPPWCNAAADAAVAQRALSRHEELKKLADELGMLEPHEDAEAAHVRAAARAAMQLSIIGEAGIADALLQRVEKPAAEAGDLDPSSQAWIHQARAFGALYAGDPAAYLQRCRDAAACFEGAGDLRSVSNTRVHIGFALIELGGYDEAERSLRDALASASRMGLHNVVATAKHNLGIALARLGNTEEALKVENDAVNDAAAQGDQRIEGASRHYLATIHMLRDELPAAEQEARMAAELLKAAPPLRAHALATLARVRLARDRSDEGLETARQAMDLLEELGGIEEGESLVRLVYAEALAANGDEQQAKVVIREAARRLGERAAKINDPSWRESFLERDPDNAGTQQRAREWLGEPGGDGNASTSV